MSPSLALLAWRRGLSFWCGATIGLLLAKPNWGLPMVVLLIAGRKWRMVAGAGATAALYGLLSLPFGTETLLEWGRTMQAYRSLITDATLPWRQGTLFASIQSLLGRSGSDGTVIALWLVMSGILFGAAVLIWYRSGKRDFVSPRLLGVALLSVVTTTPYAHFYDLLLPLPAALLLWRAQPEWSSVRLLKLARILFIATWIWMHFQFLLLMESAPSLTGSVFQPGWLSSCWTCGVGSRVQPAPGNRSRSPCRRAASMSDSRGRSRLYLRW